MKTKELKDVIEIAGLDPGVDYFMLVNPEYFDGWNPELFSKQLQSWVGTERRIAIVPVKDVSKAVRLVPMINQEEHAR